MTQEGPGAVPGVRIGAPVAARAGCWEATAVTGGELREVMIVRLPADPDVRDAALAALAPVRKSGAGHRQEVVGITAAREGVAVIAAPAPGVAGSLLHDLRPGELVTLGLPIARELAALHARGLVFGADAAALGQEIVVAPTGRPVLTVSGWVARRVAGGPRPASGAHGDLVALAGLLAAVAGQMSERTDTRWTRVVDASDAQDMARALRRLARPRALPVPAPASTAATVIDGVRVNAKAPAASAASNAPAGSNAPAETNAEANAQAEVVEAAALTDSVPDEADLTRADLTRADLTRAESAPVEATRPEAAWTQSGPSRSASTASVPLADRVASSAALGNHVRGERIGGSSGAARSPSPSALVRNSAGAGSMFSHLSGARSTVTNSPGARPAKPALGARRSRGTQGAGRLPARPTGRTRHAWRAGWSAGGTARLAVGVRRVALPAGLAAAIVVVATVGWSSARHGHSGAAGLQVHPLSAAGAVALSPPPRASSRGGAPRANADTDPAGLLWPTSAAGWTSILAQLDQARGAVFASGRSVAAVDVPGGSAYATDSKSLSELNARGLRAQGLLPALRSVALAPSTKQPYTTAPSDTNTQTPATAPPRSTAAAPGTDVILAVSDTLPAYRLVSAGGKVASTVAGRGIREWRVTLRATAAGWRIVEVAAA